MQQTEQANKTIIYTYVQNKYKQAIADTDVCPPQATSRRQNNRQRTNRQTCRETRTQMNSYPSHLGDGGATRQQQQWWVTNKWTLYKERHQTCTQTDEHCPTCWARIRCHSRSWSGLTTIFVLGPARGRCRMLGVAFAWEINGSSNLFTINKLMIIILTINLND